MSAEALDAGPTPMILGVGPVPVIRAQARSLPAADVVTVEDFGGVTLTLRRPLSCFAGVMMAQGSDDACEIALVTRHGDAVRLETAGEEDAIAIWRAEARRFGLPMVVWSDGVGLVTIEKSTSLADSTPKRRRRFHAAVHPRRPRFLSRRKATRLPLDPVVHRATDRPHGF